MSEDMEVWMKQLLEYQQQDKMTAKQKKIMQAAIEIFSEKGYAASSTQEIAQRAGVAEGTIFRHFRTKKDLLLSIVTPMVLNMIGPLMLREFANIIKAPYDSIESFLRAVIRNRLEFVRNNLPMVKIFIQEIPFHEELRDSFKEIAKNHVMTHFVKVVEHYQQQGEIIEIPLKSIIRFIVSNIIGLISSMLFFLPELDWDEELEIERTIEMILHGITSRECLDEI